MKTIWGAYLEDYNYIKIIVPKTHLFNRYALYLNRDNLRINLQIDREEEYGSELHLHTSFIGNIDTHLDYQIEIADISYHLDLGKIIKTTRFDNENYYDGPLGFVYNKEFTIFRVWSPVSKQIKLVLKNSDKETTYDMNYLNRGLWELKIDGDLEKYGYYYMVRVNNDFKKALDPYAIASTTNSEFNYVIDLEKTRLEKIPISFKFPYTNAIIYEMNIRDFTYKLSSNKSMYLKCCDEYISSKGNSQGINYLSNLGITHVQVLPINSYAEVDEHYPLNNYNWGYNPIEYNVPTGAYATHPDDPYNRIIELKTLINCFHNHKIGINLDVVYNHVYLYENFSINVLVPGYPYRHDNQGFLTDYSGCGNDLATEKKMISRFIIDSLVYWLSEYDVDGFRFDLMGIIDCKTMIKVSEVLKQIKPNIMLYGEGWEMAQSSVELATINNNKKLPSFAFFNDYFRDVIRGNPFNKTIGYAGGQIVDLKTLQNALMASIYKPRIFINPNQSINFIECHDNATFFDHLQKRNDLHLNSYKDYIRLGLSLVLISQGVPFIHAGQILGQTKHGFENTYNMGDLINSVKWEDVDEYQEIITSVKDLIGIRQKYSQLRLDSIEDIINLITFINLSNDYIHYQINNKFNSEKLEIIIKNNYILNEIVFLEPKVLLYNSMSKDDLIVNKYSINKPGVYILKNIIQ